MCVIHAVPGEEGDPKGGKFTDLVIISVHKSDTKQLYLFFCFSVGNHDSYLCFVWENQFNLKSDKIHIGILKNPEKVAM